MSGPIEVEVLAATKFVPTRIYEERQDYLAALARAVDLLDDPTYDALSDNAKGWLKKAVNALNNKRKLPDLDGGSVEKPQRKYSDMVEADDPEAIEAAEGAPIPSPEVVEEKPVRTPYSKLPKEPRVKGGKPKPEKWKGVPPRELEHLPVEVDPNPENLQLDKWGIVKGTKNSAAADLLEKGCRMADVDNSIGGVFYNLLKRLAKQGHHVEKASNGMITLIHKDAV